MDQKKKNATTYFAILILIVVAVVAAYLNTKPASSSALVGAPVSNTTLSQLKDIAMNQTLASAVGSGSAGNLPTLENGTPIYTNGKPTIIYIGADYCPFCAATRWTLIIALMRFGNFTSLHYMESSPTDYAPSTPTFTFYNSSYFSNLIYFAGVETLTRNYTPLSYPDSLENATFNKYNLNNPALPSSERGGIPFVDFANKSVQNGAEFSPTLINKLTWSQIIQELNNPNSQVSQAIIGSANIFTAQICSIDNYTPRSICSQNYVKQILRFS
ncbi:MAG: DUF929 family protein [Candidatus Micrarchaeia archaeon]